MYIDAHAHLDDEKISSDTDGIIERAKQAGVTAIIQNGINQTTNEKSLSLGKKYDIVKVAMGIYPSELKEIDSSIEYIKKHADEIIAIGEVGIDGTYDNIPAQKELFSKIISLAQELNKPLCVHSRKAEMLVIDQLEKARTKRVHLHCFMGQSDLVKRAIKLGYYFSIPCNVLRSEQFKEIAKLVPSSLLLTETDSPYLPAVKGEMNEPSKIPAAVKVIAEIKGMDETELKNIIFQNYRQLFN